MDSSTHIIEEYLLIIKDRAWRVYGFNEEDAKQNFLKLCDRHISRSQSQPSIDYWEEVKEIFLKEELDLNKKMFFKIFDFDCVREVK